ncbi:hypothetical protein [Demequina aurantiaca]|uniref:hypothetical protein n=1 Tax=Demequina aurantiaca TaxID=676200 RepID=UPI003D34700F
MAWIIAAPAIADAVEVTKTIEAEQAWIDAGGYVFVATGMRTDDGANPIPASVCERLSKADGISASFALQRTSASGSVAHIPGGRASIYDVSAGALPFLGVAPATNGVVLVTHGFLDRTGVSDGEAVRVTRRASQGSAAAESDPLTVRVADTQILGEEFDGALLMPAQLTDTASACYVKTDAAHYDAVHAALPAYLAYEGEPSITNPRLFGSEFTVDYTTAFQDRPLRWMWIPAAALLGLLWAMLQWSRRSQTAIYATFGVRVPSRIVMQTSEWAVLAITGLAFGWAIGITGALALGARTDQALALASAHAALTLIGASVLVILIALRPTGTLLNALKDR